ncbi:hypothetical protein [Salinithrix halophila]|uniref:DUF4926 domain-containing protein n=1 Tax=Salinithrix halophila TaxID=1485204 RepID=A0ABV8J9T6_9BACL
MACPNCYQPEKWCCCTGADIEYARKMDKFEYEVGQCLEEIYCGKIVKVLEKVDREGEPYYKVRVLDSGEEVMTVMQAILMEPEELVEEG